MRLAMPDISESTKENVEAAKMSASQHLQLRFHHIFLFVYKYSFTLFAPRMGKFQALESAGHQERSLLYNPQL